MDLFNQLLMTPGLYNERIVPIFSSKIPKWNILDSRKKELLLSHLTTCILLANQEEMLDQTPSLKRTREPKDETDFVKPDFSSKKPRYDSLTNTPSCSWKTDEEVLKESEEWVSKGATTVVSGSSSDSSSSSIILESGKTFQLRFQLAYSFLDRRGFSRVVADRWECPAPTKPFDIVDNLEKKFITVILSDKFLTAKEQFLDKIEGDTADHALAYVNRSTGSIKWLNHPGNVAGETKVKDFIVKRHAAMIQLGISDCEMAEVGDLDKIIFCSPDFEKEMGKWIKDWSKEINTVIEIPDPLDDYSNHIRSLTAPILYEHMSKLDEEEREGNILWRGKLFPDPFVHNTLSTNTKDKDLVDEFMQVLKEEIESIEIPVQKKRQGIFDEYEFLETVYQTWEEGFENTFSFYPQEKMEYDNIFCNMLGFKMKGTKQDLGLKDGYQDFKGSLKKRRYHPWFSHVCYRMPELSDHCREYVTYGNLLEDPEDDGHPLAVIANKCIGGLWDHLLRTNSAIYSSKMAGLYSRLGGAYGQDSAVKRNVRNDIAIIPIYATLHDRERPSEPCLRLLSGICLRGPCHVRNPTDRIPIVTIERLLRCEENYQLFNEATSANIVRTTSYYYLVRQNSIMKEDPCYLAFNINSLFIPTNLMGVSLLQNPRCPMDYNVLEALDSLNTHDLRWFSERFTEGVLMSAIGNSRDEGYFSFLRKAFMIILAWKRNEGGVASLDVVGFSQKMNDCLIDNPLSMYFHRTLVEIVRMYVAKGPH